ncbi:metallophosphoesterase family protein [Caldisericum exile]|uniref:Phosphoesterase n=1 Tax=Caldisericum exile (strain DSM 21853 / NBRC 104410 / AZM16c01) TaxID=511051 RepID=A0A7U6GEU8_CALEA|nr:YfcE family phosphodiesterase [Caldisericum exile]BAL81056.1 putative phosphodiesterase [Caldisericum exile AZM16c01]
MIKILVVSDIHYPDRISVIPDLSAFVRDVDAIFALGDFTSIDVLNYLNSFKKAVYAVFGNMDELIIREHLKDKIMVNIGGLKVCLTHGSGGPKGIEERIRASFETKCDAYVFGHTHQPMNRYIDEILLFNPGSLAIQNASLGYLYAEDKNIWGDIVYL